MLNHHCGGWERGRHCPRCFERNADRLLPCPEFFFKQWGEWKPCDDEHSECRGQRGCAIRIDGSRVQTGERWRDHDFGGTDAGFWRAGKRAAGRLLDGRTWDEVPT